MVEIAAFETAKEERERVNIGLLMLRVADSDRWKQTEEDKDIECR
jgi:hypothetical protein